MMPARKSECPGGAGQVAEESRDTGSVSRRASFGNDRSIAQDKTLDTLTAAFALRGHAVHELADGSFLVAKWGMVRACPSLDALQAFARQIGAV